MATFLKLQQDLLFYASEGVAGEPLTMAKASINRAYRRVLRATRQDSIRREFTLASVSGTAKYGLPLSVKHVLNIEDPDNDRTIDEIAATEFDLRYPGRTDSGDPTVYYILGT